MFLSNTLKAIMCALFTIALTAIPAYAQAPNLSTDWMELTDVDSGLVLSTDGRAQLWADVLKKTADEMRATGREIFSVKEKKLVPLEKGQLKPTLFTGVETDQFIVSAGLMSPCDSGANSFTASKSVHSVCPFRVGLKKDDKIERIIELPEGCAVWRTILDNPKENSKTLIRFEGGKIELKAIMEGQRIAGCDFSYSLK